VVATNQRHMPVPPEAVWDVLADPFQYGDWVVGSKEIRAADPGFPAPGTKFHHSIGIGPLTVRDHTEVVESARPHLLRLRAKARPIGTATVVMEITATSGGSTVRMSERPDGVFSPLAFSPLVHVLTKLRNAESLRRLEELVMLRAV
jgi:uncharacterized protein YndB with AHSA1/START domain